MDQNITLNLTALEVDALLNALARLPLKRSYDLFNKIRSQAMQQPDMGSHPQAGE